MRDFCASCVYLCLVSVCVVFVVFGVFVLCACVICVPLMRKLCVCFFL